MPNSTDPKRPSRITPVFVAVCVIAVVFLIVGSILLAFLAMGGANAFALGFVALYVLAGAAVIGGVGTGIFKDFTAIDRFINIDSVHTPDSGAVEAYGPVKEAFESCYFALEDAFKKMARHL